MEDYRHPYKNSNSGAIIGIIILLLVVAGAAYFFLATNSSVRTTYSSTAPTVITTTAKSFSQEIPPSGMRMQLSVTPLTEGDDRSQQAEICAEILRKQFSNLSFPVSVKVIHTIIELHMGSSDAEDIRTVRNILTTSGQLSIHLVHRDSRLLADKVVAQEEIVPGYHALPYTENDTSTGEDYTTQILIRRRSEITGKDVKAAFVSPRDFSIVNIELTDAGGKKMETFTKSLTKNVDMIATVLDGKVKNYATLAADSLGSRFVISGEYSKADADRLASALESPLTSTLKIIDQRPYSNNQE